ncbi:transporter substrate-binding domain-containing protein [Georgenia thermotolerans]|uniref:Transporter substrate-binding domain-containing protein n=1 Tax=Georgenia thermotolerans TaxID=527326 RepID=A0A7J5UQF9_9MICO|nr:transporter substrate-binding domain-containing protein [Georgenia thermotolerans]KAE8764537.1 transporter substrate-binding domain-containing protein [Georgenia thermotolerans]
MTTTTRRRAAAAVTAGALAVGLAACGSSGGAADGGTAAGAALTLDQLRDKGTVTVGFAGEAPYSFEDGGELTGATVALHEKIWSELGVENVKGVQAEFGQLIQGLNAGRFDVIAAGMSILPERCEQASFSDPEFMYTTALMVPEGNPLGLSDMQSIVDAEAQMAAMSGAIEATYATDLGISPMEVGGPQDGMDAVVNGRADVFALTGISLNWMKENNVAAPVEVTESFVAEIDGEEQVGAGGTVFRDADTELRDAYNEELAKIVGDEQSYLDVVGDFGFTAAERPTGDLTTEQLCSGQLG